MSVACNASYVNAKPDLQIGTHCKDFSMSFSVHNVVPTAKFIGRKFELQEIRSSLRSDGSHRCVMLQGLGGIGKTQLAIAYALQYADCYSAIVWLDATNEDTMKSSFVRFAKQILNAHPSTTKLGELDLDEDVDEVIEVVKAWFNIRTNSRWLMICDNHDNPKSANESDLDTYDIHRYLPGVLQGSVIITTRSSKVSFGHCIRIRKLDLAESREILEVSSGRVGIFNSMFRQEGETFHTDLPSRC